jgi:Homeodomain-like domain
VWVRIPPRALTHSSRYVVRRVRYNSNVRSIEELRVVRSLVAAGLNDCEIARQTGIPRSTVRDWRHARRRKSRRAATAAESCSRCGAAEHAFDGLSPEYVYLLGMYLGDGYIVATRDRGYRLIVAADERYPNIIAECVEAIRTVVPGARPYVQSRKNSGCIWVIKSSKQWPCLFPQHGPGRKHERPIVLTAWQHGLVKRHPELFLRGLIHSDGCRSLNRIWHGRTLYAYPRYTFSNASADIRQLFCDACDLLGIEWRVMNARNISIARRASVARLDEFVGPKR